MNDRDEANGIRIRIRRGGRPRGCVVAIAGPDGSGKTTLVNELAKTLSDDREVAALRRVGILPRRTPEGVAVTEPHGAAPYGRAASLAKVAYLYADYLLGWTFKVRRHAGAGGIVLLERGWWDHAVDPLRYRLAVSRPLLWRLGRLLPKPDAVLVLEAPPGVVSARKNELGEAEVARQSRAWRDELPAVQPRSYLDATLEPRRLAGRAAAQIKALGGGAGWVGLPDARRARWLLPRASGATVHRALHVYHPVTSRGWLGWQAARAAAVAGAFRFLPPAGIPPGVAPLLAPYLERGGSFALARCNHPGRYVALLLGRDGRAVAAAKLALSDPGKAALRREATAIREVAPLLPGGLIAPRLIAEGDGVVVMEPVDWRPRLAAWRLPDEVALRMGVFFRRGADAGGGWSGPAHGDLAPWNLLRVEGGWALIDWESAMTAAPPFYDVFHHLVRSNALLGRPSLNEIRSGLRGRGWVGSALRAYIDGADLEDAEPRDHFVEYLVDSGRRLHPEQPDGRRLVGARDALMRSLFPGAEAV